MNAAIVKKITIIIAIFIAVILLSVGCNFITRDKPNPSVSNPDSTFLSYGNVTITRQTLYDRMKIMEGISHLTNYVDEILLGAIMDGFTQTEVDTEILRLKFGTTDQDEIDKLNDDQLFEVERNYRMTLVMAGFNPDEPEDVERFVRLTLAREASAKQQIRADISDHPSQTLMGETETHYQAKYRGDAIAIQLLFATQKEAEGIYMHFNLVPFQITDVTPGLRIFVCDDEDPLAECDISKIARGDFDEDNTRLLDPEEVFAYFLKMHNYLYAFRNQLDPDTLTMDDLIAFDADYYQFEFNEMQKSSVSMQISTHLFDSLGVYDADADEEDDVPLHYTSIPRRYSNAQGYTDYYVSYLKLHQEDQPDLDELDQARIDELTEEMIKERATSQRVTQHMVKLRYDNGFVLHDTHLNLSYKRFLEQVYQQVPGITATTYLRYEAKSDPTIVASFDDFNIKTDDFFDYLVKRLGALFTVELLKEDLLINGEHYEDIYGNSRNFATNNSQKMRDHRNIVLQERQNFANYAYAPQYTPDLYEWREFLYLAYGFASDDDLVRWLVVQDLLRYLVFPNLDFDKAMDYVEDQFEHYFSLRVEHILVSVDFDENLRPDNFHDFLEDLNEVDRAAFNLMKGDLENLLKAAVEDGQTLKQVVDEYKNALRGEDVDDDDYSKWAVFKNYGLRLHYEDLSAQQPLTYKTTTGFAPEFVERLQIIYTNYLEDADQASLLDDRLFDTEFGLHLVKARKSTTAFERPSAKFANDEGTYDERWENDGDMPTLEQIEIWSEREFDRRINGTTAMPIPAGLDTAIKAFFGQHHDGFYPSQGMDVFGNLITLQKLESEGVQFPMANDHIHAMFSSLIELYEMILYPEIKDLK